MRDCNILWSTVIVLYEDYPSKRVKDIRHICRILAWKSGVLCISFIKIQFPANKTKTIVVGFHTTLDTLQLHLSGIMIIFLLRIKIISVIMTYVGQKFTHLIWRRMVNTETFVSYVDILDICNAGQII